MKAWWSFADIIWAAGSRDDAQSALEEAISLLAPAFFAAPGQYLDLARPLVSLYVARCDGLGTEPSLAVLDPIVRAFETFRANASGDGHSAPNP